MSAADEASIDWRALLFALVDGLDGSPLLSMSPNYVKVPFLNAKTALDSSTLSVGPDTHNNKGK